MEFNFNDKYLISILHNFDWLLHHNSYTGPRVSHDNRFGESVTYTGIDKNNKNWAVEIIIENGKFEVFFRRPVSFVVNLLHIYKIFSNKNMANVVDAREIFALSDYLLQSHKASNLNNNINLENYDDIIHSHSKFIEESLVSVIKGEVWFDELLANKM